MTIGKIANRKVVTLSIDKTILDVAKLMKESNVGDVIIVNDESQPVGIITDRDIAIKIVADEIPPNQMFASDVMSSDLLVLREYQAIQEAFDMMCAKGVRRAPIVDELNKLTGIVSSDDLVLLVADEIESYGKLIRKQVLSTYR
jgi:CBS domain-containing protein